MNKEFFNGFDDRMFLLANGILSISLLGLFCFSGASRVEAAQSPDGHIPRAVTVLKPIGRLPGTNRMNLTLGLPLRNADALGRLLKEISDPASPNFRHYLTPSQFAEQFGPADADYQAVLEFAKRHGLTVGGTHPNRVLLDVSGAVQDIEQAFHVKMQVYQHPTEGRTFFAPDTGPTLDLATPVLDVSGLQSFSHPLPLFSKRAQSEGQAMLPEAGSGPGGTYLGKDFRAAYAPDTTLTGAGQRVGLLEFDGYTASDIAHYESVAGFSSVVLSNVLLDGFNGQPTGGGGQIEVTLDIEMAISMAPGLSGVLIYEAGPSGNWHDILNRIADDNLASQISCSWYYPEVDADPVAEQIFQQMAVQGQSFFAACGDSDAYTGSFPFPDDSPSITLVGGTTLTTSGPAGSWVSETVWNWGGGHGTGGGISTYYPIPAWQTNISMTANLGSTTKRNVPDVALTANGAYVYAGGQGFTDYGGTSFASPLWAGFMALVNEQAALSGRPTVGFVNPALDVIGTGQIYSNCFHDITTGNNTSPSSPTRFYAVPGYDLCTGWGVPAGQKLINALAIPDPLGVVPDTGFTSIGGSGGPFTQTSGSFTVTNSGTNSFTWSMVNTSVWLTVSPPGGTLAPGGFDSTPLVSLSAGAYSLPIGDYSAVVAFSNVTSGVAQSRQFTLEIVPSVPPGIVTPPANETLAVGSNATFTVIASGTPPLNYQWQVNATNVPSATNATLTLTNLALADAGTYTVTVTNTLGSTNASATLTVGYPPSITTQPLGMEVVQGSNALFSVTAGGTGPFSYQWYFYGSALAGATNSIFQVADVQATNGGFYNVEVSSPFGSILSSNVPLTVDLFPIILTQPQSQFAAVGSNATFSVSATGTSSSLPVVTSGTLQLWLKADTGVVTNSTGQVSQWDDQSGNTNHAFQGNTNQQPLLASAAGLGGLPVVRFNGIQSSTNGSWLHGTGLVNIPNAMTAFTVYNCFSATNNENTFWDIGIPGFGGGGANRIAMITAGDLHFSFWSYDFSAPFIVPTNTYRIRTDQLTTNLATLNMIDATAGGSTNFTLSTSGAVTPGAGYYLGGLDTTILDVGSGRNFDGDLAEVICYQGYLSQADIQAVTSYLEQKYFQAGNAGSLSYQWQFDGTNIDGATNATLTLTNVQFTNEGVYVVVISNFVGTTASSNATLVVGYPPVITNQPQSHEVVQGSNVSFSVGVSGTGPLGYEWSFDGAPLAQATNSTLLLTNLQGGNSGTYSVIVSSPFGSAVSSNVTLEVELFPIILSQPQSQSVLAGSNVSFSVTVAGAPTSLPPVSSGTLQLWLKADTGVVTNSAGFVTQWQDQSGNSNNASQSNTNLEPELAFAPGLGGKPVVRFNGIQYNTNGSWLHGTGSVSVPNAMTAFTVYNCFSATNSQSVFWGIGVPGANGAGVNRIAMINAGDLHFSFWSFDYSAPFIVPTNTYRIRIDQLDTNLDALNMFDVTASGSTNFTLPTSGAGTPGAGYYLGGFDTTISEVGSGRDFDGDLAEVICYQGDLSPADQALVTNYLEQKFYQAGSSVSYQWQVNGTNIAHATNATLTLSDVQVSNDGSYTVIVSNLAGVTVSSNAVLAVGFAPSITNQPQSQTIVQGSNVTFNVGVNGTGPLSYDWSFDGAPLAQATNPVLTLTNVQATNGGSYSVVVSSPYGSVLSSNAVLTIELLPVIIAQPQSQTVLVGTNVTFSVTVPNSSPVLPSVTSGTLELWLKADTGVLTNSAGQVTQWLDQSGNSNNASQSNTNLEPVLAAASGLSGKPVVRFNGIQYNTNGSYLHGTGSVNVPNAMTAFTVYNCFSATNAENVFWGIGIPGENGAGVNRIAMITFGDLHFSFWSYDYSAPFIVPTNTYRIRTDQLTTNLATLNMFDAAPANATNFTLSTSGAGTPGAGYYLGGFDTTIPEVGSGRNFNGDLAELVCYRGDLSPADMLAVTNYLEQKYFQAGGGVGFQWQVNGTNIANATNSILSLANVQITNDGIYTVLVSNFAGVTVSSNAVLAVGYAPSITNQPQSQEVAQDANVSFTVGVSGTGPLSYLWLFDGTALQQGTNATLSLTNVQGANSGSYSVFVSSPFGSYFSSNATLKVDLIPAISTQPQSQTVLYGSNATFSVSVTPVLPQIGSGTLQLWLKADTGVVTNSAGQVSQWDDQSGNTNHAFQGNTNQQPLLASAAGLGGLPVVRFNGIQSSTNGSWLHGTGLVNVPNAMTAFTVYNCFSATNNENTFWDIGIPGFGGGGANRIAMITAGDLHFSFWSYDFSAPFIVPTNTYRIRTDQLTTNLATLNMIDTTAGRSTNFTLSTSGAVTPGAGYYLGGLDTTILDVGSGRNFDGDLAEVICYQGYLSQADMQAVTGYLEQKYFQAGNAGSLSYQWQFDGTNIDGATNSALTVTNVQFTNDGIYTVVVGNGLASTTSSNAVLTVGTLPVIRSELVSLTVTMPANATFRIAASGVPAPSFQWQVNNVKVPGGTGDVLTVSNVVPTDGGAYTVIVSNSVGTAVSSNAILLVNYVVGTGLGQSLQLATTNLTLPSTVQPGLAFTVSAVDPVSQQGGPVQLSNGSITYNPPVAFTGLDIFNYVLTPSSGPAIAGRVTVLVDSSLFLGGSENGSHATVQFAGAPGAIYNIEASTDLINWSVIGGATVGPNGTSQFQDTNAGLYRQRFYRTSLP